MRLERLGETVTREELRNRLWTAETFVDFDHGVNKAANRIRDALGDSATSPRFIAGFARRSEMYRQLKV
jgi:cholera toxin transcriptional activator